LSRCVTVYWRQSMNAGTELNKSPERELGLHDDRATTVQTSDGDGIEARQSEHGGRVALLVDAMTRRPLVMSISVDLFRVYALHSLIVTHVDTERPSSRQVVIDQLNHTRYNSLLSIKQRQTNYVP